MVLLSGGTAHAMLLFPQIDAIITAFSTLKGHEIVGLALTVGAIGFAVLASMMLVRTRARWIEDLQAARADNLALRGEVDQAMALLAAEPQVLVVWAAGADDPQIIGDTEVITSAPIPRRSLAFGTWLKADLAQRMEAAVAALRERGESFMLPLTTLHGQHVEAEGRAIGGKAILRLRDVSGSKRALAEVSAVHRRLLDDVQPLRTLLEALSAP
ncbi:MAG: two-component sensor histidine kinase, partial [Rhizobiales bacterium]|nr:two-component sensor histidine kinase [Hyphomicrobiales bacterium]